MAAQQPTNVPTTAQMAAMTPGQRQAYMASLDPNSADAASAAANMATAQAQANMSYLTQTVEKIATCYPAAGGITAAYTQGASLYFNFPTAAGAFVKALLVTLNLNFTPATGTGATYGYTAGAPYSFVNEIQILFNGTQARIRPYLLKVLEQLRARSNPTPAGAIAASNSNAGINVIAAVDTNINTPAPTLTGGSASQLNLVFRIPLNVLHELSPIGMLPIQGSGTKAQVVVLTPTSVFGPDPLLNAVYATGGTGNAVTVNASTVKVEAIYTDGTNLNSPTPLSLDMVGVPTAQYIIDTPLTPLAASILIRQRIATLLQHYYVIAVVIDGNQSNKFAAVTNFTQIELDQDSVGQNKFYVYGLNNVSIYDYFEKIRHIFQRDLDEGVVPWVVAESYGQENPDNRLGSQALNMTPGGWTDVHHAYILGAVNGLGTVTGRVELYLVSLNPAGLVQA